MNFSGSNSFQANEDLILAKSAKRYTSFLEKVLAKLSCSWAIIFSKLKGALLGQKAALYLWYVDIPGQILKNCSRAFEYIGL